jgi:hypothetical protein
LRLVSQNPFGFIRKGKTKSKLSWLLVPQRNSPQHANPTSLLINFTSSFSHCHAFHGLIWLLQLTLSQIISLSFFFFVMVKERKIKTFSSLPTLPHHLARKKQFAFWRSTFIIKEFCVLLSLGTFYIRLRLILIERLSASRSDPLSVSLVFFGLCQI